MSSRLLSRLERWLAFIFRAPSVVLRLTEAVVGEDSDPVVRIDPSLFARLGVAPGGQLMLEWFGRETAAVALEQTEPLRERWIAQMAGTPYEAIHPQGVALPRGALLPHLTVWVPAPLRAALGFPETGLPKDTVVRVRRRLSPIIRSRLGALALPVAGTIVAILALPDVWLGWVVLAGLLAVALSLAPLRATKPPSP